MVFVAVAVSCGCQVTREGIVGTYVLRYPYGVEELRLANDGTYEQTFRKDGGTAPVVHTGRWTFKAGGRWWYREGGELALHNCMLVDDLFGKPRPPEERVQPGVCLLGVQNRFGHASIVLNEKAGFVYRTKS
jgi:hypothetical protein